MDFPKKSNKMHIFTAFFIHLQPIMPNYNLSFKLQLLHIPFLCSDGWSLFACIMSLKKSKYRSISYSFKCLLESKIRKKTYNINDINVGIGQNRSTLLNFKLWSMKGFFGWLHIQHHLLICRVIFFYSTQLMSLFCGQF